MWDPQLPALADRRRVVRYDHRGHGRSSVPPAPYTLADLGGDVVALLDQLAVERFGIGGLSLGGMVAMWVAAHHPDRVESLALFCTSAFLPPAQGWLDRATLVREGGMAAVAETVPARWFTPAFAAAGPQVVQAHREMLVATPVEGYAGCCEAISTMDLRPVLSRITAPTLVVAGRDDPVTPEPHAREIATGIEAGAPCRVELVDGAHLATVESAPACTALLLDHLDHLDG